ncbi:MAG: pyrroloquinoline quinone-dependent dehydrogenase [Acidobacteria bacterium]|nr:MAG: pyrroloquinoline quinone-dependent dehydrogenase [Acidobacteriota bacterium]
MRHCRPAVESVLRMTVVAISMAVLVHLLPLVAHAQTGARPDEWRFYGGGPGHTKYSPLDQITKDNVDQLRIAWTWTSVDETLRAENPIIRDGRAFRTYAYEATPLLVDGVLYTTTNLGQVAAIDPTTGDTLWSYDPGLYLEGRPAVHGFLTRGLAYWTDGDDARLFYAGGRTYLVSVDAETGEPDVDFGRGGRVDLTRGLGRTIDPSQYAVSSPPVVVGTTVVVGSAMTEGTGRQEAPPGHVRGYDVRTGEMKWIFHTIPQPGELGNETWGNESWKVAGGANVWSNMSADLDLGYVYLPVGSPVTDYYGGHRPGDNLCANSLVCLDADTGERVWHFQFVHHTVWDYDLPAAPNLIDITVDGRQIKAVAQITKQGFTFVFDRATGEPVWPIEERPVPQSTVPGERTSPTQPFPTRPPVYLTNGALEADLIDFTEELRAEALEIYSPHTAGPLYTPPALGGNIVRPGWSGGANWWGAAFDPETARLYVPSWAHFSFVVMEPGDPARSDLTIRPRVSNLPGPQGLPLFKPPYSQLVALDMNAGEVLWSVPLGDGPRNHEALRGLDLAPLGNYDKSGGPLLTRTLLFIGQGIESNTLRAFDKDSGDKVFEMELPARSSAAPITYLADGVQYIVIAVGGGDSTEQLVALALP